MTMEIKVTSDGLCTRGALEASGSGGGTNGGPPKPKKKAPKPKKRTK